MAHGIIHIEIAGNDYRGLATWYNDLFDWDMKDFPEMEYLTGGWQAGGDSPGLGFMPPSEDLPAGSIIPFIYTDDVDRDVKRVVDAGGTIVRDKVVTETVGEYAYLRDPGDNLFALMTPEMPAAE